MDSTGVMIGFAVLLAIMMILLIRKLVLAVKGDPAFWEWKIRSFERQDRRNMPPPGGVVFTGSSSIRYWETLEEDMTPLSVVNRGFGGSQIHQVTYFANRIIIPYQPGAVVLYAGENDIAGVFWAKKKTPEEVLTAFKAFCEKVRGELTETLIFFVSIKPPVKRCEFWAAMRKANCLIEAYSETQQDIHYVDITAAMQDAEGKPRIALYKDDGVHMRPEGYAIWTSVIKPIVKQGLEDSEGISVVL